MEDLLTGYRQNRSGEYILSKRRGDFDALAERFSERYAPETLTEPSALDLGAVTSRLGLTVETAKLKRGILGVMIFGADFGAIQLDESLDATPGRKKRQILWDLTAAHGNLKILAVQPPGQRTPVHKRDHARAR